MPTIILITNNLYLDLVPLYLENFGDTQLRHICNEISNFDEEPGSTSFEPLDGVGIDSECDLDFGLHDSDLQSIIQDVTDKLNSSLMDGVDVSRVEINFTKDYEVDLDDLQEDLGMAFPYIEFIIRTEIY